jgi:hypothetical protein
LQFVRFHISKIKIDIESLIYSIIAIVVARILTYSSSNPVLYVFSIMLSFVPLLILSFKIVTFLERKNAFVNHQISIKLSLFGLFITPIVFIPLTIFSYITHLYVILTFIIIISSTSIGERIHITKKLLHYFHVALNVFSEVNKSYLIFLQISIFIIILLYLITIPYLVAPSEMDPLHLTMLGVMIIITAYMVITDSKLKEISIMLTALFLFLFLAIQGSVYYGGDSGVFISVTKYLLSGNEANFVSPSDRWRFGSLTILGLPSLSAYLSEASQVNPEFAISYANAIGIVFIFIGGYLFRSLIDGNQMKKTVILMIYVLAQPAVYYYDINPFRASSTLILLLPLTVPLLLYLRFNMVGKLSFILAMFSIGIIHPLSFPSIILMIAYLFKRASLKGKILLSSIVTLVISFLLSMPRFLRSLSISTEQPPALTFTGKIHSIFFSPLPPYLSTLWPAIISTKVDFIISLAFFLILLFKKVDNMPRIPLLGFIALFFVLSSFITSNLFPIERLSMVISSIGSVTISALVIGYLQTHKFRINKRIQKTISISFLSLIIIGAIFSGYPRGRSLYVDTYNVSEHALLKNFVNKEKFNFNNSIILAHVETIKYIEAIHGSILHYNNAPKVFLFDFTDRSSSLPLYTAFTNSLKGNLSSAINLAMKKDAKYIYLVIIFRLVPNAINYKYGDLVAQSNAGMIRKITIINKV